MKRFIVILSVILFLIELTDAAKLVYEFGADVGQVIYSKDGAIPVLKYETIIEIPVPEDMSITYIIVTVDSLSPPKVDYEANFKQVTIRYTWVQVSASLYNIIVKGTYK